MAFDEQHEIECDVCPCPDPVNCRRCLHFQGDDGDRADEAHDEEGDR